MSHIATTTILRRRYSVGTWDTEIQAYTPQIGVEKSFNLTIGELRDAMKRLRELGYRCHRFRQAVRNEAGEFIEWGHSDNDTDVLIERTDGMTEAEILESWQR